jgi:cytoskeletal protein CcmA (bactofilin family)
MFFRRRTSLPAVERPGLLSGGRSEGPAGSVIGKNTRFRGEIHGDGALRIRGHVEGTLRVQGRVTIEAGSWVHAAIFAPEMILAGTAEGEFRVPQILCVQSSGRIHGDVTSGKLLVQEGAVLRGTLHRMNPPPETVPTQSTP